MAQGQAIMASGQYKKNARNAWRTVTDNYRIQPTDENKAELRDKWAAEMVQLFGGKVTADAVFQRLSALRGKGGLPPVPQGQKGRVSDPAAEQAELQAEIAELEAAGFKVNLDDKGNIAEVIPPSAE